MTDSGQALLGSVFGGYDWQMSESAVIGFMGDATWSGPQSASSMNGSGGGVSLFSRSNFSWSALARVGFLPTRSTLLYAAAGYAGEYITTTGNAYVGGASADIRRDDYVNGWTVGPGIETVVSGNWSTRLEYRYSQFEEKQVVPGATVQPTMHSIRAGLSYKFGPTPAK
jgi:outer membrane immunogenic protein